MIFCARATRGLGRPSLDTRSGGLSSQPSKEKKDAGTEGQSGDYFGREMRIGKALVGCGGRWNSLSMIDNQNSC